VLVPSGQCLGVLSGHTDEVLDVDFDYTGQYLASASADSTARVYNATTHQLISKLEGHSGEISRARTGNRLIYLDLCKLTCFRF